MFYAFNDKEYRGTLLFLYSLKNQSFKSVGSMLCKILKE